MFPFAGRQEVRKQKLPNPVVSYNGLPAVDLLVGSLTPPKVIREAVRELSSQDFQVVFLDHDPHWMHAADNAIVEGTGKQVALHLKKTGFLVIVVIHSKNENGVDVMQKILPTAKIARFGEFGIQIA